MLSPILLVQTGKLLFFFFFWRS